MAAVIQGIASYLPERIESNVDLGSIFPHWKIETISKKLGIESRHIAGESEFSSHLATRAGENLFGKIGIDPSIIDCLIVVTQTPDYLLPSTSTMVHEALGLRRDVQAFDINQGCSGYPTALGVARSLIASRQAANILLITSDTYSKLVNPEDRNVRLIFGDAATATLISNGGDDCFAVGHVFGGTDGSGAEHLIARGSAMKRGGLSSVPNSPYSRGLPESDLDLFMNGREIFKFADSVAPSFIQQILDGNGLVMEEIDKFVFHQANAFMLSHLANKIGISETKMPLSMKKVGNTVSSSIPLVLEEVFSEMGKKVEGNLLLFGFGVGLSWSGCALVSTGQGEN